MTTAGKDPAFVVKQLSPLNGGVPAESLAAHQITPTEFFFVRNHAPVPQIDPGAHRLAVTGLVRHARAFTVDALRREFQVSTVEAALECAGNRRTELAALRPIPSELPWAAEAVGNARWTGVPLAAVLDACGVAPGAGHVAFVGADRVVKNGVSFGFGGSIPLEKAKGAEVLLAFSMNGQPLRPEHGAPLRVITPGYIGARSVKWITEIHVTAAPSDNYFQQGAYRLFPPDVTAETADHAAGTMLGEIPPNAVITTPAGGAVLAAGRTTIRGYALGGAEIARVAVSVDGGKTWQDAALGASTSPWAWRLWELDADLRAGDHDLAVRAYDTAGRTQPEDLRQVWNIKGYVNNAVHRIRIAARP
jgi:sulfite oxidase